MISDEVAKTLILRMPFFNAFWVKKIRDQWFKNYFILLEEAQRLDSKKDDAIEAFNEEF